MSTKLNVLIYSGASPSGGREHAFGWKIKQSPRCGKLYFSPGNGGTAALGTNIPIPPPMQSHLVDFVEKFNIDLVVVGPEAPLAEGVVDILRVKGVMVVGPTKRPAQLETSKAFAKTLMDDFHLPTAPFMIFDDHARAVSYVRTQDMPLYIKASGLCGGKGAFPCLTIEEAERVLHDLMVQHTQGTAGDEVVIEQFLQGEELSVHAFCDGTNRTVAPTTRDHKKLFEPGKCLPNGTNPNTGGMGAFGPVPGTEHLLDTINLTVGRTLHAVKDRLGEPFTGILYPGFMVTSLGPKILEFNVRGGDPETQVLMRLLRSDALDLFEGIASGSLLGRHVEWEHNLFAVCVVMVSGGYPGKYDVGFPITGLHEAGLDSDVEIFHAGTKRRGGEIVTAGGRVLNVTATGETLDEAIELVYEAVECINFPGMHYRDDIGAAAIAKI
jgi:phosphoribosylamine--glycine ligase